MTQDFNSKLLKYCIYDTITKRKLGNLYKCICDVSEQYGGFTVLQAICIKSYLKTLKHRIEKKASDLLPVYEYYFEDFVHQIEAALEEDECKKNN